MSDPNTQYDEHLTATAEIERLFLVPTAHLSTLDVLPKEVCQLITGSIYGEDNFALEWLDLKDLASLALVSWDLHNVAQPLIDAANQWRHTDVVPRIIADTSSDYDRMMLPLFTHNFQTNKFDVLVYVFVGSHITYDLNEIEHRLNSEISLQNKRSIGLSGPVSATLTGLGV